jgi:membrane-associated phospholipid phosphatase
VIKNFAAAISILFHPLLMPTYLFFLIIQFAPSLMHPLRMESLYEILAIIFLVSFIIPSISISALRWTKYITDFSLADRKQRFMPVFFIGCFYSIAAYMFYTKISVNHLIFLIFTVITVLIFLLLIITFFWKISIHGAGAGGALGIFLAIAIGNPIGNVAYLLSGIVLVCGLIIFARLAVNAHTPRQVYTGAVLGLLVCFFAVYFSIY